MGISVVCGFIYFDSSNGCVVLPKSGYRDDVEGLRNMKQNATDYSIFLLSLAKLNL